MKRLRLRLVVLLALLMIVRGSMAAAMLCLPAGVGSQIVQQVIDHPVGHPQGSAQAAAIAHDHGSQDRSPHVHAAHGNEASVGDAAAASDAQSSDVPSSPHDECNMCSAFCSVAPLVGSLPAMVVSLAVTTQRYSTWDAKAVLFMSDGQDRPPRRI